MSAFRLVIPGRLQPKQSVRTRVLEDRDGRPFKINGRWATSQYQPPKVRAFETFVAWIAKKQWGGQAPLDGPLWLRIEMRLHRPQKPKAAFPDRKPDWLNLVKPIEDALERAGVIANDARIVHAEISKFYEDHINPVGAIVEVGICRGGSLSGLGAVLR